MAEMAELIRAEVEHREEESHNFEQDKTEREKFKFRDVAESDRHNRREISNAVKKLFKKISMKTHPDRTQNKSDEEKKILHELFLEAKIAYASDDLHGLEEIWSCVKSMKPRLLSRLIEKLQHLMLQLQKSKVSLNMLKKSSQYNMLTDFKVDRARPKVEQFYKGLLLRKIERLKREINFRDATRYGEEAKPQTIAITIITTTNSGWTSL